jgi:hypothetical protein
MTLNETIALCKTFNRKVKGVRYYAYASEVASPGVCFDFEGNPFWGTTKVVHVVYAKTTGTPTIPAKPKDIVFSIVANSPERVQAHWESFLVNHKAFAPITMQYVSISNGPNRDYRAKVVRTTKTRALVTYKFNNGKWAANKWVKLSEISW